MFPLGVQEALEKKHVLSDAYADLFCFHKTGYSFIQNIRARRGILYDKLQYDDPFYTGTLDL